MTKLTLYAWRGLVKTHLRRAFLSQWIDDKTDAEMDYAGERLVAAGWTVEQTTWCIKRACGTYTRLEGPLAMICRVNEGRRDREGNVVGGWKHSKSFRTITERHIWEQELAACRQRVADNEDLRGECGTLNRCQDCDKRDSYRPTSGVSRGENPQGGLKPLSEILPPVPEARNA